MVQAAELQIQTTATAMQMAEAMFGAGVAVVSASFRGDPLSSGIYTGGQVTSPGAVPADQGVILSTGLATDMTNAGGDANQAPNTSTNTKGIDGDTLLNAIAGVPTYDAAIFEADFIPTGDTLTMQLVFSSEEYLEWVHAGFNDAVGIWVNGTKADLTIGDGDISIDNINTGTNENLFIDNAGSVVNTEMDGLTVSLTVKAPVAVGVVNTIRFAIADAGDAVYDSNLLIVGDSVQTQLIAMDDTIPVTAKGATVFDPLANDKLPGAASVSLTHINGQAIAVGQSIVLDTGETLTLLDGGQLRIQATPHTGKSVFTYTISDGQGGTDIAYATIDTEPVDGSAAADAMMPGFTDAQGNQVEGEDGAAEVIMGYGGNDKIFAGLGDDDIYGGTGNDFIRAGAGDDLLEGGAGNDVLDGGSGKDTMSGGAGNDIYYLDQSGDTVAEAAGDGVDLVISDLDHSLGDHVENLRLTEAGGALSGVGNALDNMIAGNGRNNILTALAGNDRVLGMAGDDDILGGDGRDTIDGGAGDDQIRGGADKDKLTGGAGSDTLSGDGGNDLLRGGASADVVTGGNGSDVLDGGGAADAMAGGLGNDIYFVQDVGDTTTEAVGEGTDRVISFIDWTLQDNTEHLRLRGDAQSGTGNALDNSVLGTSRDNALSGLAGSDDLRGKAGDDSLSGGAGDDRLIGGQGGDVLQGGTGDDRLNAGGGADVLIGGAGNDRLYAGAGADEFRFASGDGADVIRDFSAQDDSLALSGLTAGDIQISKRGNGIELAFGAGDSLYLSGVGTLGLDDLDIVFL